MKITIGGDLYVSNKYNDINLINNDVIDLLKNADIRIINLESPITKSEKTIIKTGPHLKCTDSTIIPLLKKLKIDIVTLGNNHIMDYGDEGLVDTIEVLNKNNISYVGAGLNKFEAGKILTLIRNEISIAILNFAENEWSSVNEISSGANPLDVIDNIKLIRKAKKTHDKVICIIHGGNEYYNLPSPRILNQYRFYAESGADAIVCHHTHTISGYEVYRDVPIFYGLGNLLFTIPSKHNEWYEGMCVTLNIQKDKPIDFEIVYVEQDRFTFNLKLLDIINSNNLKHKVNALNDIILDEKQLMENWLAFIRKNLKEYEILLSPINAISNRYLRSLLMRLNVSKMIYKNNYPKLLLNLVRCEAHRDVLLDFLKFKTYKSNN